MKRIMPTSQRKAAIGIAIAVIFSEVASAFFVVDEAMVLPQ